MTISAPVVWKGMAFTGLLVGLIVLMIGAGVYFVSSTWIAEAQSVDGEVVALEPRRLGFSPTVEFWPADAIQPVRFTPNWSTNPPAYDIGEPVPVLFQAAEPTAARIDAHLGLWWRTYALAGFGALFCILGVAARVVAFVISRPLR